MSRRLKLMTRPVWEVTAQDQYHHDSCHQLQLRLMQRVQHVQHCQSEQATHAPELLTAAAFERDGCQMRQGQPSGPSYRLEQQK